MSDTIFQFINTTFGVTAGVTFAIIIVVIISTYNIAKHSSAVNHFKDNVTQILNSINDIRKDIAEIKGSITPLEKRIDKLEISGNKFAQSNSPFDLSPVGLMRSQEMQVEEIIANHWDKIKETLDDKINKDTNPYDIQVRCFEYAEKFEEFITKDELENVKKAAFAHGDTLGDYWAIFGIIIRNKYLNILGIDINSIDKHNPNKKNSK